MSYAHLLKRDFSDQLDGGKRKTKEETKSSILKYLAFF